MNIKYKNISLVLIVLSGVFILLGSTFAYWVWNSESSTLVSFTVRPNFSCSADGGGDITSNNLIPTDCTNSEHAIKRTVSVNTNLSENNLDINLNMYLDINSIGVGLSNSENFKYALTTSSTSCTTGVISSGTFQGKTNGDRIQILNKMYSLTSSDTYYLYIWLDSAEESLSTANQSFNLSLSGDCANSKDTSAILNGATPVLDTNGMIPVVLSDDGSVTTISETSNDWYDYENKKWANAILVTKSSRSNYLNTDGVPVNTSDILAYWVWVPRYKYKIWQTGYGTNSFYDVDIVFEDKNTPKSLGTTVGSYRTHPAFTFGSDELNGIWVGKYFTSGTDYYPLILPGEGINEGTRTFNSVFRKCLQFRDSYYGVSYQSNSHLMKNSEWGAALYLSRSIFGINRIMGTYFNGTDSKSTTDNITGIFNMGDLDSTVKLTSGIYCGDDNDDIVIDEEFDDDIVIEPPQWTCSAVFNELSAEEKYFDIYTSTDVLTACNGGICFGHGLSEISNNSFFSSECRILFRFGVGGTGYFCQNSEYMQYFTVLIVS